MGDSMHVQTDNNNLVALSGDALSRKVLECLLKQGKVYISVFQKEPYPTYSSPSNGEWIQIMDGDTLFTEYYPPYGTDAHHALTLLETGWNLRLQQFNEEWSATYYNNPSARGVGSFGKIPAEAVARAWLLLQIHLEVVHKLNSENSP